MSEIERVRQQLLTRKGQWRRIAQESGVAHRAIYNVVYAKNDPRTSTIQALARWLQEAQSAAEKAA